MIEQAAQRREREDLYRWLGRRHDGLMPRVVYWRLYCRHNSIAAAWGGCSTSCETSLSRQARCTNVSSWDNNLSEFGHGAVTRTPTQSVHLSIICHMRTYRPGCSSTSTLERGYTAYLYTTHTRVQIYSWAASSRDMFRNGRLPS